MDDQVVIAGAGPVGLWLAAELRLAGVSVTVLEPRLERDPKSKALTVHPRTVEVLASRGAEAPFLDEGLRIPNGHFAALEERLDFRELDTDFPFTLSIPQARTEELLEELALARGAAIRRGHRVTDVADESASVKVTAQGPSGPYTMTAQYVVGCDGTHSTVRRAAGIDFPGTGMTAAGWLADVTLGSPPASGAYSRFGEAGGLMIVPLPGGLHRMVGLAPEDIRTDWPGALPLEEARRKVVAVAGTDFGAHSPVWLSRFSNASRQARSYRQGRVLLAGDAAHQHMPAGGVGLNVGVQDAMNLGWKLAAVVTGRERDDLLDSYHDERHPVGADLLESTQAQTALMCAFTPDGQQLRALLSKLIADSGQFARALAERLSGLAVRYPPLAPDSHPLTGRRSPNLKFADSTLFERLRSGHSVQLDFRSTPLRDPHPDWADVAEATIRPDGHVAWAR